MIDYKTLKHSENGMPTWDAFLGPTLQVATTKPIWRVRELSDAVIEAIQLPPKLAQLRYPSKNHDLVAINRVGWAISDLKIAGLLETPKRGSYRITKLGKKILAEKKLEDITKEYVHSLPKYIEHQNEKAKDIPEDDKNDVQYLELDADQIDNWFAKQKEDLSSLILTKLRKTDPFVFEHMMIELLKKMGL